MSPSDTSRTRSPVRMRAARTPAARTGRARRADGLPPPVSVRKPALTATSAAGRHSRADRVARCVRGGRAPPGGAGSWQAPESGGGGNGPANFPLVTPGSSTRGRGRRTPAAGTEGSGEPCGRRPAPLARPSVHFAANPLCDEPNETARWGRSALQARPFGIRWDRTAATRVVAVGHGSDTLRFP